MNNKIAMFLCVFGVLSAVSVLAVNNDEGIFGSSVAPVLAMNDEGVSGVVVLPCGRIFAVGSGIGGNDNNFVRAGYTTYGRTRDEVPGHIFGLGVTICGPYVDKNREKEADARAKKMGLSDFGRERLFSALYAAIRENDVARARQLIRPLPKLIL